MPGGARGNRARTSRRYCGTCRSARGMRPIRGGPYFALRPPPVAADDTNARAASAGMPNASASSRGVRETATGGEPWSPYTTSSWPQPGRRATCSP